MINLEKRILSEKKFLGIDESNHGRYPEVFVAVLSDYIEDIQYNKEIIGKLRNENFDVKKKLEGRDFYYFVLTKKIVNGRNLEDLRVAIFSEIINTFYNIETAIIDGEIPFVTLERINSHLEYKPKLIVEAKADIHYPIVNFADAMAYFLYNHYIKESREKWRYKQHKLNIHNRVRLFEENFNNTPFF
jgi:hypothetical protein